MDYIPKFARAASYADQAKVFANKDNLNSAIYFLSAALQELCWCFEKKEEEKS